jgi:hypothetical protein
MANDHSNEAITSAPMDYPEHVRTYDGFIWLVKYGTIAVVAILLGMLASLIGNWGIFGGLFAFVASGALLSYILR